MQKFDETLIQFPPPYKSKDDDGDVKIHQYYHTYFTR